MHLMYDFCRIFSFLGLIIHFSLTIHVNHEQFIVGINYEMNAVIYNILLSVDVYL